MGTFKKKKRLKPDTGNPAGVSSAVLSCYPRVNSILGGKNVAIISNRSVARQRPFLENKTDVAGNVTQKRWDYPRLGQIIDSHGMI